MHFLQQKGQHEGDKEELKQANDLRYNSLHPKFRIVRVGSLRNSEYGRLRPLLSKLQHATRPEARHCQARQNGTCFHLSL